MMTVCKKSNKRVCGGVLCERRRVVMTVWPVYRSDVFHFFLPYPSLVQSWQ
jgi:hypothetical protein